jgi:hypothetical protein
MKLKNEDRLNAAFAYIIQHRTKATLVILKNKEWALSDENKFVFFFKSNGYSDGHESTEIREVAAVIPVDGNALINSIYDILSKKLGE